LAQAQGTPLSRQDSRSDVLELEMRPDLVVAFCLFTPREERDGPINHSAEWLSTVTPKPMTMRLFLSSS
jgi:hypothetical protein